MLCQRPAVSSEHDWPFAVRPLTPRLGAEILDVDLRHAVDPPVFRAIFDAFLRHQVLLFNTG